MCECGGGGGLRWVFACDCEGGEKGVGGVGGCNGEVVVGEVEVPDIRAFLAEDRVNREQCLRR